MEWKDLTESLRYRKPHSPYSYEDNARECKELPRLSFSSSTILRISNTSFLLIFGGHDTDSEETSSKLIVINLRHLEWWYETIEGGPVAGRIDPTIVAIDRKLYIFGGYRHFKDDGAPHASYSIAALSDSGTWCWEACDVPYPQRVPPGSIFGRAVPIYNGNKILLTPWRTTSKEKQDLITFTEDNMFCFHVLRQKFQPIDILGDFPDGIQWYYTIPLDGIRTPPPPQTQRNANTSTSTQPPPPPSSSSVLICGWKTWIGSENDPTPDIWHLELTSIGDRIRKVNIGPMVHDVGSGFEGAAVVGERLLLFGSTADEEEYHEVEAALNPDAVYDRYLEISLRMQGVLGS